MARVEKNIEVNVPVRTAYNQWTQFESFPEFMDGVQEVHQLDDTRLHWKAKVGGKSEEWEAVIREQIPDQKIIWQNTSGRTNAGMVKFDALGPDTTRVHLEMSYDPEGFVENVGDALGFMSRRVEGDLTRFKEFIESRGMESGAWRGEVQNEKVPGGHTRGSLDAGEGPGSSPGHVDDGTRMERSAGGTGRSSMSGSDRPMNTGSDVASTSSAMRGTDTTGARSSSTGSGYTAEGMTGQGGGSMQGGASTSYGNPGRSSGTEPGGVGGEYPERSATEDQGGMGGEYPERGSR